MKRKTFTLFAMSIFLSLAASSCKSGNEPSSTEQSEDSTKTETTVTTIPSTEDDTLPPHLASGKPAPQLTFTDMDGNEATLSDLGSKALFIDIWATWCGPCKEEIPYMHKLQEHFANDERIQIVSISCDEDKEAWKKFVNDKGAEMDWSQYIVTKDGQKALSDDYAVYGIPRFMMIDAKGNFISSDAPRPSEATIIEWIEGNLK